MNEEKAPLGASFLYSKYELFHFGMEGVSRRIAHFWGRPFNVGIGEKFLHVEDKHL
jgi:hypothetical protein